MEKSLNKIKYILSIIVDNIGTKTLFFLLPLMIFDKSGSIFIVSFISAMNVLPFLLLGLPFGAVVDKINVKKILYISDFFRFIAFIIISIVLKLNFNTYTIMLLGAILFIVSCLNSINTISELTFISYFVDKDDFAKMNSLIYAIQYIIEIGLPFFLGFIYYKVNLYVILKICACLYIVSSLSVKTMSIETKIQYNTQKFKNIFKGILKDIVEGFYYLLTKKEIFYTLFITTLVNLAVVNFQNDSLFLFKNYYNFSNEKIGALNSFFSLGSIVGVLITPYILNKIGFKKLFILNLLMQFVLRLFFCFNTGKYLLYIVLILIYMLSSILNLIIIINRQNLTEQKYLGRVNSIYKTVLIGVNFFGFLLWGTFSNYIGSNISLLISAILLGVVSIISIYLFSKKGI